jgi:hypothetical protein
MADSYSLLPTFYTDDDKVLILAEIGTEYSWGLVVYELVGDAMRDLGPINATYWSGESNVNPLAQSKVTSGKGGYRVQFYSDLTLNPGGLYEWTLPRLKDSISFVQDRDRFVLEDDSVGNQVCFFLIDESRSETADDSEVRSDFVYYIREIVPWLKSKRIAYSFQERLPLKMIAAGRDEISISGEELQMNIGVERQERRS